MNRKNLVLTMLACLNCTHTTHAMIKSAETQIIAQDNGQESWDELLEQCKLQNLRIHVGEFTGNPDRDAVIKREIIMQKLYAHKKDALLPDDPLWSLYKEVIDLRRDIVKDLSTLQPDDSKSFFPANLETRFNNKIKEWVHSGKMTGLKVDTDKEDPYVMALYAVDRDLDRLCWWGRDANVPPLSYLFSVDTVQHIWTAMHYHYQGAQLTKYSDIAKQRRDVYRKLWAHDLNSGIKNEDQWIANIRAGIQQLDASNTEIGQDMKKTILNTIRNNLLGADKDLKERTIALLQQDPVLTQMIWNGPKMTKMLTERMVDPNIPLLKMMHHREQAKGPLKKPHMNQHVFREMLKY